MRSAAAFAVGNCRQLAVRNYSPNRISLHQALTDRARATLGPGRKNRRLRHESRDSPSFPTMYGGREALPDDHKFRGQRGRVRARYRRPQLGRGTEKIGETSQRKTNLQLASGAFSCKVAPFTPAGERTKKAPSRGGRTGSNGQQHPVVIDCEVLQKRSRCTTPGELRYSENARLAVKYKASLKAVCCGSLLANAGHENGSRQVRFFRVRWFGST